MSHKIAGTAEAWDEGLLGESEAHVALAPVEESERLDKMLGLQSISIRLPRDMIEAYKLVAAHHGVGYQPLMRDILQRNLLELIREVLKHHENKASEVTQQFEDLKQAA